MINMINFDSSLLNIDEILFKSTTDIIYNIKYITMN